MTKKAIEQGEARLLAAVRSCDAMVGQLRAAVRYCYEQENAGKHLVVVGVGEEPGRERATGASGDDVGDDRNDEQDDQAHDHGEHARGNLVLAVDARHVGVEGAVSHLPWPPFGR